MSKAVAQREHTESRTCWCEPLVYEPCSECEPFNSFRDDDPTTTPDGKPCRSAEEKRDMAIKSALAVLMPVHGVTARRPAKSKGCWKCLGNGIRKVEPGDECEHGMVFHRPPKPEPESA